MDKDMYYSILVSFHIQVAKWRIDDPKVKDNWEYSLAIYDRNKGEWVNINDLKRPGEFGSLYEVKLGQVVELSEVEKILKLRPPEK